MLLLLRATRRVNGLERARRSRARYRRLPGESGLERSESFERRVAIRLRGLIAGAIRAVACREKFEEQMRLIEREQLGLPRGADQLLAGK
jgi:hypothetical protein